MPINIRWIRWSANLIFFLHVCLGIFYLTGWLFPQFQMLYFTLMGLWVGSWVFLGYCPLSRWEFSLRKKYDPSIDPNREIIQFYLQKTLGITVPSKTIVRVGLGVCAALVMASFWMSTGN